MVNIDFIKKESRSNALIIVNKNRKIKNEQPLTLKYYDDAVILPFRDKSQQLGGVVTSEGVFVDDSGLYEERSVGIYEYDSNDVTCDSRTVMYIGMFFPQWGHALTDDIKKLWWNNTRSIQFDAIVYTAEWDGKVPSHVKTILKKLGIDIDKCERITRVTRFAKVIDPDNSFVHHDGEKYYTEEYWGTIQRIKNNVCCHSLFPPKLYFTRSRFKQGWLRDNGEESIEKVFKKLGYAIISPEKLSVDEQIAALMGCTHFATTEGSIAHGSVFCNKEAKVTLIRKVNYVNPWQLPINNMIGFEVTYVDAHNSVCSNKIHPMIGPFYMCVTPELERYIGHRIFHLPLWLRPSWYRYRYQLQEKWWYKKGKRVKEKISSWYQ